MKKALITVLLVTTMFSIRSEPAEDGAVYFIESADGVYQERTGQRWFIFLSGQSNCKIASYLDGELDRCMKVDETGQLYNFFNAPAGTLHVSEREVRIATQNGTAVFKRSTMSHSEAIQYSGQSEKAIARRKDAEERAKDEKFAALVSTNNPTFTKLIVDSVKYLDKPILVHGFCGLDDYYNYGYKDAQGTHYSVSVFERRLGATREMIYVYFKKTQFATLPDNLEFSSPRSKRRCKVGMVLRSGRFAESRFGTQALFEGTSIEYLD